MKTPFTPIAVIALLLVSSLSACDTPKVLIIESPGIRAQGYSSAQREWIEQIELDPRKLPTGQDHDLWIGLSTGNRMLVSEITEESIRRISVFPSRPLKGQVANNCCSAGGFGFDFEGGNLTHFGTSIYGDNNGSASPRLGSQKSGRSLSLPCSVDEYEQVFGKAAHITRRYYE